MRFIVYGNTVSVMGATRHLLAALIAGLVVGCGGTGREPAVRDVPPIDGAPISCAAPGQGPASKLRLRPTDGVPGQYIAVFFDSVPDIEGTANELARKYGGRILFVYQFALRGFALALDDAKAPELAAEADVCFVEQDGVVHAT